jgi:hypothetical protein
VKAAPAAFAALVLATCAGAQVTPAKPTASADANVRIESTIMSWAAMNSVAEDIAKAVDHAAPPSATCVVVVTTPEAVTDANVHRMLMKELASLKLGFDAFRGVHALANPDPAARGAIDALTAQVDLVSKLLNSVLGIVTLFRADKTLEGLSITPDEDALAALVAGKLKARSACGRGQLLSLSGG